MKNKDIIKLNDKTFLDLVKLIASKLFIYANSGYGKSWLIRRILEQSFGQIQQIVIDPEGEFSTLRERYDYVLVGKGYDVAADPKTAALLAHRLLKEKVSAIIDIYELEPLERERFVANFTQALVNVPKELAHPYLYLIDEAQDFAPEKGDALSSKAMLSIAKKGRKRGCCPIFATQRVADFSKSVIAACNNKLIGQASLDIDMKRCAAELGFSTKEQMLSLRDLDPGEFFAFGPAISKVVQKIKVGSVHTSHPDSSKIGSKVGFKKVIPASARVKKALAALADLPKEADKEANTIAELKAQIRALKMVKKEPAPVVDIEFRVKKEAEKILAVRENYYRQFHVDIVHNVESIKKNAERIIKDIEKQMKQKVAPIYRSSYALKGTIISQPEFNVVKNNPAFSKEALKAARNLPHEKITHARYSSYVDMEGDTIGIKPLSKGAKAILSYLHSVHPAEKTKTQLWVATGYSPGGGFNNLIYELTGREFIMQTNRGYKTTNDNYAPELIDNFEASLDLWKNKLGLGARKVFELLLEDPDTARTKEELAAATGYALGGGFNNNIYELTGAELVKKQGTAYIINPEILDL